MSVLDNRPENPLKTNYGLRFRIGLAIALFFVCVAFQLQWATGAITVADSGYDFEDPETIFVEPTPVKREKVKVEQTPTKKAPKLDVPVDIILKDKVETVTEIPDIEIDVTDDVVVEDPVVVAPKVDNTVHTWVEHMPQFPGGEPALKEYLSKTPFCSFALENDIEGTVYVSFVIDQTGSVVSVHIDRGVTRCLDDGVSMHINNMPKWKPGKMGDQPVKVKMGVPIRFSPQ